MVEKRSLKFTSLKNENVKLLIPIIILLSSLMAVASLGDTPPIANCGPDKLNCQNVNTPVQFNASASYDSNGSILFYEWDFGDGTTGTGVAPNHTYTSYRWNGSAYLPFIVHLNVTNDLGEKNITSQQVTIWISGDANGDGVVNILDGSVVGLKWKSNDECADLNNDGSVNILDASIIGLNWNRKASDNTPPAGVTHLINVSFSENYINWTWTGPDDTDFASVSVWIDGEFKSNVPKGKQFYEATGFSADSEHNISTRTTDMSGNLNQTWVNHTARTAVAIELPPDPVTVAPPVDPTVATSIATSTSFLYSGSNPIQTGIAPGTLEARRAAVLRGRVLTREGTNLSGVNITILSHPEFGRTMSRADGMFDMAVNGGGLLTVNYEKEGYLPSQRQVQTPWQDYAWLPDVVMIQIDTAVTTIHLSSSAPIQVAQGSVVTDNDGTRQARLLFPQGVKANITLPDGTTQSLTTLNVRATEYTVGENGPEAMPAQLPPTSGYTYAVELSVDEAMASGATDVRFDNPVYFYVDNFLNFPVGGIVPVGYYDRNLGLWIPSENGLIIQILSITGGMADIDVDGSGTAADVTALSELNITDAERQQLAALYLPGQSLWRVPIIHFSPWDCNWPYGPSSNARFPTQESPNQNDPTEDNSCKRRGSIIGCQDQVLGEVVDISGTPFRLHYQSNRATGSKGSYSINIPLSNASLPASLKGIDLEVSVAGRRFTKSFQEIVPNMSYTFTFDGLDAYERKLQGQQPIVVRIGYVYDAVYLNPGTFINAFAVPSGMESITGDVSRQQVTLWQKWEGLIGIWDAKNQGLGGWSLDVNHAYDIPGRTLYLGDGGRRSALNINNVINRVAGNGESGGSGGVPSGFSGDGGQATLAQLNNPYGIAVSSDGSIYISDNGNNRIRRVGPDGIITTVAGNGERGFSGDGGQATMAQLKNLHGITVSSNGSIYISDSGNNRIRRVGPDGIITTVAGNGEGGFSNDGGQATMAQLNNPYGIAVSSDGSIYISDSGNNRIRRVGSDGIITTVAGNGEIGFSGDGGQATMAQLNNPYGIAVSSDGSIYISDSGNNRIRRVGPDGIITTVAGKGAYDFSGDGGQATMAQLNNPYGIAVSSDGSIYISDNGNNRIRRVGSDGIITTVAGNGEFGFSGDSGQATLAQLNNPYGIAVSSDGSIYISDSGNHRIRYVVSTFPGFSLDNIFIPSEDGSEIYVFNNAGKHLRTLDAVTGAVRYQFTYGSKGTLTTITDSDNNTVTIERDAKDTATAFVTSYGQRTGLSFDANGYLASITGPAGDNIQLTSAYGGLLIRMTDPKGGIYRFSYDELGRLLKDEDPAGGINTLERTEIADGYKVDLTTGMERQTTYQVERMPKGGQRLVNTFPGDLKTETLIGTDGSKTLTYPDGTSISQVFGPDPRFGMLAPVLKDQEITTPGGLAQTTMNQRTATLANPNDLLSLQILIYTISINGRTFLNNVDMVTKTITSQTPMGRTSSSIIDNKGRITESQVPNIIPVQYIYDDKGRLNNFSQGSRAYSFSYDAQGNLANIIDPLSRSVAYEYDAAGRVTKQILPDGRDIRYAYDTNGNVISITPPGRPDHAFNYTPVDMIEDYLPPVIGVGTTKTHYTYNFDRELIRITRPDGATIDMGYDSAGRLSAVTYPQGTATMAYDPATGKLKDITTPDGGKITYAYDGSLLTDTSWSGAITGSIHRTYDNNFWVTSENVNSANNVNFQYDQDGMLTQAGDIVLSRDSQNGMLTGTGLGSVTDALSYSSFGEVAEYQAAYGGAGIFSVNYARDDIGRIVSKNETIDGAFHIYNYSYDLAGRLTNVSKDDVPVSQYTYDANGNRLSYTGASGTISGTYDDQDRLMQYGSATYAYSANGELLSKTNGSEISSYHYDVLGNLLNATLPDGTKIEYIVDGHNRRIGKKVNGVLSQGFLYENQLKPIAELDGAGYVVSRFVYASRGNVPDYMVRGGNTYRIITDHLGSPRLVIDAASGAVAQRMDYDEFGNVVLDSNPGFQPFGFAGGLYDRDTRLVRFGARDYDAELGRWTAKDPIAFAGGDTNLFGYVLNNPINLIDQNGLEYDISFDGLMSYYKIYNDILNDPFTVDKISNFVSITSRSEYERRMPVCEIGITKSQYYEAWADYWRNLAIPGIGPRKMSLGEADETQFINALKTITNYKMGKNAGWKLKNKFQVNGLVSGGIRG